MSQNDIPKGYMRNASGHLVPKDQVREHDLLRDEVARSIAAEARILNESLRLFRNKTLADLADLVRIAADKYGVTLGGEKGNVSITSYDGSVKIVRSVADRIAFTEEIEAAKALINACIDRWSKGADANIKVVLICPLVSVRKARSTSAVLELLRLEITDEEWLRAMEALKDSIQSIGTSTYLRVYERVGASESYVSIPLDLAAV